MIDLRRSGTPEAQWLRWAGLRPARALAPPPRHVVVVAPHPDDEVLGAGGTLALWAAAATEVTIVAVTDGEGSHPASPTWSACRMRERRRAESTAAWAHLGLDRAATVRLALRDGHVADHVPELAAVLHRLCTPATLLLAPWSHDGHPDHEAAGRAARHAAAATGAAHAGYPVWMWHWASPGDPRVPWPEARIVHLGAPTAAAKRRAAAEFTSQIRPLSPSPADQPVLPGHVLERLLRDFEVFFV